MPTYQYRCFDCEYEFEEFQSMTEPAIEVCPACKGRTRRLISGGAGLIFKGSGFYITDHRNQAYKSAADKDKPATSTKSDTPAKSETAKPAETKKPTSGAD